MKGKRCNRIGSEESNRFCGAAFLPTAGAALLSHSKTSFYQFVKVRGGGAPVLAVSIDEAKPAPVKGQSLPAFVLQE